MIFDHIGIVTDDIDRSAERMIKMFGITNWTTLFEDPQLAVKVRFLRDPSGLVYELIAPLGETSPVLRALRTRTNLLNQIAYKTTSLESDSILLRSQGAIPTSEPAPAVAFGGARVQFFFTKLGFIVELVQFTSHRHQFNSIPAR